MSLQLGDPINNWNGFLIGLCPLGYHINNVNKLTGLRWIRIHLYAYLLPPHILSIVNLQIECNLSNRHSHELVFVVVADIFFIVKQGHSIFCYNIDIKCTFLISFIAFSSLGLYCCIHPLCDLLFNNLSNLKLILFPQISLLCSQENKQLERLCIRHKLPLHDSDTHMTRNTILRL